MLQLSIGGLTPPLGVVSVLA